jgi:hypothetical protein
MKSRVIKMLNVADLFHLSIIMFQHSPQEQ